MYYGGRRDWRRGSITLLDGDNPDLLRARIGLEWNDGMAKVDRLRFLQAIAARILPDAVIVTDQDAIVAADDHVVDVVERVIARLAQPKVR